DDVRRPRAEACDAQQHTGAQLRIAGFGPGAANIVGLTDQTDTFKTIIRTLGIDALPRVRSGHLTGDVRH
ncbi:MAG: hypothetical protein EOO67_04985, partial [Microbacterium sp.]